MSGACVLACSQRLFWLDPYLSQFEARVVATTLFEGRPAVTLDRTAFYPTSGGQPHDVGYLNDRAVIDVIEIDGQIVHILSAPLTESAVSGAIDWERRFDHMQQHTGQHLLSAAFEQAFDAHTVSFHLGELTCTIDIARRELDSATAREVESAVNAVILANRTISAREYSPEEAVSLALRKAPPAHERIRVITVAGFDRCACGGTHVRAAGEVGLVHLRRWERRKDQTRVEFLCGWRALRDYAQRDAALQVAALELSVGSQELQEAIVRLASAAEEARREAEHLRTRLLDAELPQFVAQAEALGPWRLVCRRLEGYDAGNMRYLANKLVAQPGAVALLAVDQPSPQLAFARAEDVPYDMGELLRQATAPFGGRGGGRPHMAQGGGVPAADLDAVLAGARALLIDQSPLPAGGHSAGSK